MAENTDNSIKNDIKTAGEDVTGMGGERVQETAKQSLSGAQADAAGSSLEPPEQPADLRELESMDYQWAHQNRDRDLIISHFLKVSEECGLTEGEELVVFNLLKSGALSPADLERFSDAVEEGNVSREEFREIVGHLGLSPAREKELETEVFAAAQEEEKKAAEAKKAEELEAQAALKAQQEAEAEIKEKEEKKSSLPIVGAMLGAVVMEGSGRSYLGPLKDSSELPTVSIKTSPLSPAASAAQAEATAPE